ncbi:MAG: bifunctional [glutamate--ammonia ligase]-adenylyl-L-tyrosine phosphorylase/[glutamate--ammonia-ligase] adenylyltransferase [Nitrosomonas sp.]|uniref:bifunctional [glutamate--ammonia ligase]-adenylyl-L-tyrosine phosphorylase/[glutamate--ammonia-ligase] adenylyltransferase n=1 Tax=Nitrosomonas sp. TaxID=42353 RepID=UPI0025FA9CA0|nr:bifunctional [glutamate--ammonia ligase]-adenylyl-L-tyrosine phosphorylase/[glutamate--ammonia-ligase] adenylyltransferase [Nitrosomonas sp.]MBY0474022.1 bifunctional [glutamate--ammonia ligase]-adenylyl-L-tyrosine phosphorylase/[glutamate--ammonia-ligase] adenylyltransferase [Nitrosomonas sp.]
MDTPDHSPDAALITALPFSRYAQRLLESEPARKYVLLKALQLPLRKVEMQTFLVSHAKHITDEETLHGVLRNLRKQVMLHLFVRDINGQADLYEVMSCMTELAEVTINFALQHHESWLAQPNRFGLPRGEHSHNIQHLLVVAMGKLGGGELNVSSDVDLIFVYPEEGETDGAKSISNYEFFARLGRKLIASLNDFTVDGYVFRVDMRLRPHGENSPLAISFPMLEEYFIKQGREWERHAWIKSRVIADRSGTEARSALMEKIVRPFVFRKYLDFNAYQSMRNLHAQLRKEVERREMHDNIKLGPGGIREIEFITQVFQLIRGGRDVDLCIRPTLGALQRLKNKQQLPEQAITELIDAYHFLRKLEHRLQYLDDQQTQTLPLNPDDQQLIASAMGFECYADFMRQLDIHRRDVTRHFELIFAAPKKSRTHDTLAYLWQTKTQNVSQTEAAASQLSTMGFTEPEKISERLRLFYQSTFYQRLPESSQQQINTLVPLLIEAVVKRPPVETTLERMLQLLEKISEQTSYLALLLEHPHTLQRVAKLVSISQWASDYLGRHPILLDEILRHDAPHPTPDWTALNHELNYQLNHANNPKNDVIEWKMDVLRHFQHAQVFRLLVTDLEGSLLLETLSDHLTALADLILKSVLNLAWAGLKKRHREQPAFAIIGYGKLGGKELGYVSDLDLVFLYQDDHPDAAEIYTKLGQGINTWLTRHTSAGLLYETDLRLRPNGETSLLVSSMEAFAQYQHEQAWVWEHQALTRARFVMGDPRAGEVFENTRKEILCKPRDVVKLKQEILKMREKMLDVHPNPTALFDIKHDRGGIIDVEFMVQYLVLGYACQYPQLTGNIGNIALLKLAGELGLISVNTAEKVRSAYREFRRIQHRQRLNGDTDITARTPGDGKTQKFTRIDDNHLKDDRNAVLILWEEVFGD